jgi:hypothetical protein
MSDFERKMGKGLAYGLGAGAAGAAGIGIVENQKKYEAEKDLKNKTIDKEEEIKRKKEPSDGGGSETVATNKAYKSGGKVKSASSRADGCAIRGKTRA